MALNKIIIQGRMTRDIEMRQTQKGTSVGNFSVAVDRDLKDAQTGERATDFIDCVAWGNTATFVEKYLGKGRMVIVSGRLQIRDWTDKDGNKRRSAEVVAENVYFCDSKKDNEQSGNVTYIAPAAQVAEPEFTELADNGDPLPF